MTKTVERAVSDEDAEMSVVTRTTLVNVFGGSEDAGRVETLFSVVVLGDIERKLAMAGALVFGRIVCNIKCSETGDATVSEMVVVIYFVSVMTCGAFGGA